MKARVITGVCDLPFDEVSFVLENLYIWLFHQHASKLGLDGHVETNCIRKINDNIIIILAHPW